MEDTQDFRRLTQSEVSAPKAMPAAETGIYALPVVGSPLRRVRDVADGLRPVDGDSAGVKAGKNLARGGFVVVVTGVSMMAVL